MEDQTSPSATPAPTPRDLHAAGALAAAIDPHVGVRSLPAAAATTTPLTLATLNTVDEDPAHLQVLDLVEDLLDLVGPQRVGEVVPGVKVSVCELPARRQRLLLAEVLKRWPDAHVQMPSDSGSTRGRVLVRIGARAQFTLSLAVTAVGVLQRSRPATGTFVWVLDEDLVR